jgi:uncharacterized membrane protein YtjA (UPF0391 family)
MTARAMPLVRGRDRGRHGVGFLQSLKVTVMTYWAMAFFVLALAAAAFGFSGMSAMSAGMAKVLFFVFLVLGALTLIVARRVPSSVR